MHLSRKVRRKTYECITGEKYEEKLHYFFSPGGREEEVKFVFRLKALGLWKSKMSKLDTVLLLVLLKLSRCVLHSDCTHQVMHATRVVGYFHFVYTGEISSYIYFTNQLLISGAAVDVSQTRTTTVLHVI